MDKLTVGILIIGDEILKGQVVDSISPFLCEEFYTLGIKVGKISVISDSVEDIASEIEAFSKKFTYVITTGGVGFTHDDVTYEGISKAFNDQLVLNEKMVEYYKMYCGVTSDILKNPQLRIALVPKMSEIIFVSTKNDDFYKLWYHYPIVKVSNVFIFPGVPQLTKLCFKEISKVYFQNNSTKFFNRNIYVNRDELFILPHLNEAVNKFKNIVEFGSYPVMNSLIYKTKLTLEATDKKQADEAETYMSSILPSDDLVDPVLATAADGLFKLIKSPPKKNDHFIEVLQKSVQVVEEALTKYKPESLFLNFNGGKDCTVLLHLVTGIWQHKFKRNPTVHVVYFKNRDPFPEIEEFIQKTAERYKFHLTTVLGPIKESLSTLLDEHPKWEAGLLGTRRTDPHAENLVYFQMTDEGWPKVMRINPLLDWSYNDVWTFLRLLHVPYCSLYDQGYTSLGTCSNTKPNPLLKYTNSDGITMYHPAYQLSDGKAEREGRN